MKEEILRKLERLCVTKAVLYGFPLEVTPVNMTLEEAIMYYQGYSIRLDLQNQGIDINFNESKPEYIYYAALSIQEDYLSKQVQEKNYPQGSSLSSFFK